ncbi:MAG: efflux transporter outer membrane subunit [Gammaproteobacteria bacterium]|nr:efflux transporter outer membrane subunit [Gammaproteobacteria bacterium]
MPLKVVLLLLTVSTTTGCALHGDPAGDRDPAIDIPAAWRADASREPVQGWLAEFREPALENLVAEAMARNFELRSAASRVRAGRAQARIAGAGPRPQLQLTGSASRAGGGAGGSALAGETSDRHGLNGQLSWEADLWGRLSDEARAARADWQATEADFEAARLSLAANIARQWFNLIEARAQRRLAENTVKSFEDSLATIENRYRQGIGDALDVRLARNNLETARANLLQRRRQQQNLVRGLEILAGRYPAGSLTHAAPLPGVPGPVPAGLPSQLLERRPDLVAAESRLTAAGYRLASADKNRLPGIVLTAGAGTSSDALRNLVDLDDLIWNLAVNLTQPLFQGGRLAAERDLAKARGDEALNDYAQAALTAFREVEDALDSEAWLLAQEQAARRAAGEAQEADMLALDQYRRGLTGIITLLESQRRRFNADSALIEVINLRLQNRINLYLALGGGFDRAAGPDTAGTK